MELEKNLKRLIKYYKTDTICQEKINKITKFVIKDISLYEEELEDTYNRYFDSSFKLYSNYIKLMCKYIVAGNIKKIKVETNQGSNIRNKAAIEEKYEIDGFNVVTIAEEEIINNFIVLIYSFLLDNITFEQFKLFVFIQSHDINYKKFTNINKRAAFSLCNMQDNGIDVNLFSKLGNVQIEYIDEMSNGKYGKEKNVVSTLNNIAYAIDYSFNNPDMRRLEINKNDSLILMRQNGKVYVYDENNMANHIFSVDKENNYKDGKLINIVNLFNLQTQVASQATSSNTLDDAINGYAVIQEAPEQPDVQQETNQDLMNQMMEIMIKMQNNQ